MFYYKHKLRLTPIPEPQKKCILIIKERISIQQEVRVIHVDALDMLFFISNDQNRQIKLVSLPRSIILRMQATQSLAQQLMPRNPKGTKTISKEGHATRFVSNLYEIKLKNCTAPIFQFSLDITPELPDNSNAIKDKIVYTLHRNLCQLVEKFAHKGDMLWGRKALSKPETMVAEFEKNKDHFRFEVLVKQVKEMSVENFIIENPDNLPAICQVLNINTKNMLKKGKMVQLSPGNYYHQNGLNQNNTQYGLNVWRGFKATVAPYNGAIFLQVDVCSRVLREESFLATLETDRKNLNLQEIQVKYKGSPILMLFGSLKVYHIDGLQFKMTPKNTFYYSKEGREISYIQYFKTKYAYVVKNEKQPLVRVISKKPKHLQPESSALPEYIYLIPEMLTLTGLSDAQRSNFKIMKSLDPYTKLTPQQRMRETFSFLQTLSGQEELMFQIKPDPHKVDGYQLEAPQIKLGPNRKTGVKNGNINIREPVLQAHKFQNYYFCYSVGRDPRYDQEDCDYAVEQMKAAAKMFGITICQPYWVEVPNGQSFKDWEKELEFTKQKAKEQKTDIIIFFLKPNEEKLYADLKRLTSRSFCCPSQMIKRRSLSNNTKGVLSFASKIVLQMNSKIGHPLWSVPNYHPFWREKGSRVATAGIASSKGKQGTFIAFVGTTNPDLTHIVSDCKEAKSRQALSAALFQTLFTTWLQNYYAKNQKQLPTTLVIYREGLNDTQARHQFEVEVQGLIETINLVRTKAKCPDYNPNIQYLLVNKKPNSRMFQAETKGKQTDYFNPLPGSVIFEELSKDGCRGFHLASVDVRLGSSTPVQFKVGYENNKKVSLDALAELTYNQCYCYFNWTGGVRVPACLQDANKLAKQCSEIGTGYINDEKGSDLKFKPYFL